MHMRYLIKPLAAVAVLATVLTLAASPASADQPRVFVFTNIEDEDDSDWWEVRVTVESFGGCGEAQGRGDDTSGWLEPQDEWGTVLDLDCSYTFTAVARDTENQPGKICDTLLGWGVGGNATTDELRTRDNTGEDTDVSVEHDPTRDCDAGLVVTFLMESDEVVEKLPPSSADSALQNRAERAVEVAEFKIRVTPDASTKNRRGCNQVHRFTMGGGDDGEHEQEFPGIPVGTDCTFVVTVEDAPGPFEVVDTDGIRFRTGGVGDDGLLDLTGLVKLPYARIAIIQDVTNTNNQGHASYKIARSCAGVDALPPLIVGGGGPGVFTLPGGQVVASLIEGRYTVHSPNFANFGAGANYLAVARSLTSRIIDGCEVTVSIQYVPSGCTVSPTSVQSLTWRRGRPFVHFDFEFDIDCGGGGRIGSPAIDADLPPPPPGSSSSTESAAAELDAVSDSADVRIVARRLSNGKIEFGLEQRQSDDSWAGRRLPRARLFPATAAAGRWLVSTPITVSVAPTADSFAGDVQVRLIARRLQDGRVEFALQERANGSWSDRMLPTRRYFLLTATTNRWLASSTLTLDG